MDKRKKIKKRARVIKSIVGVFCLGILGFVTVWSFNNAIKGFKDSGGSTAETVTTVQTSAPDSQSGEDASSEEKEPDSSAASNDTSTEDSAEVTAPEPDSQPDESIGLGEEGYVFPTAAEIDDDFSDAVFIGNSLTVGLSMNCGKPLATFYASTGLNVQTVWNSETIKLDNGEMGTAFDALQQQQFSRVFVMFGINEVGWPYWDAFRTQYEDVINKIRQLQPNAQIYIESVLPVSSLAVNTNEVFTNTKIDALNEVIKEAAQNTGVTYLDINSQLKDSSGSLPLAASTDGIHLMKDYCMIWLKYLADNT